MEGVEVGRWISWRWFQSKVLLLLLLLLLVLGVGCQSGREESEGVW
jgi:hypothetical protein